MGGQATGWIGAYLVFLKGATTGIFANLCDCRVIFGEPDIIGGVNHNTIRLAIAGGCRKFCNRLCQRIKFPNFVGVVFSEPYFAIMVDSNVPWSRTRGRYSELLEGFRACVKHAD